MALENFIPFDFTEGAAYVSVTKNGLTFNKAVMSKLNFPRYATLLINGVDCKIAIQGYDFEAPRAVPFYKGFDNKAVSVRLTGKDLLNTIAEMMDWDLNQTSYRIDGKLLAADRAVVFDVTQAKNLDTQ